MKNCLYKYIFKSAFVALCLFAISSLFAADFNEPRKVIISKYNNAVYKDLTVLSQMTLSTEGDRQFLLELGKRPTYFWNLTNKYSLLQEQTLNLDHIKYNNSDTNLNIFTIFNMEILNGTFISRGMFLPNGGGVASVYGNYANFLMNYSSGTSRAELNVEDPARRVNVYAWTFSFFPGSSDQDQIPIQTLNLRDLGFYISGSGNSIVSVPFVSPRMMIYNNKGDFTVRGTSTKFKLVDVTGTSNIKSYYGPWQRLGSISSSKDVCGAAEIEELEYACYKQQKTDSGSRPKIWDTLTRQFTCADKKESEAGREQYYDPESFNGKNYCYDYQVLGLDENDGLGLTVIHNNNDSYYEFKVQEVFSVKDNTVTLISQAPLTRGTANNPTPLSISTSTTAGDWTLYNGDIAETVFINGDSTTAVLTKMQSSQYQNPCFYLCSNKLCGQNIVYVRNRVINEIKDSDSSNSLWPDFEGPKQHLIVADYTVGFCPKQVEDSSYSDYESNFVTADSDKLVAGMLIYSSPSDIRRPYVCIRRVVKCNQLSESGTGISQNSYTLLTTDY